MTDLITVAELVRRCQHQGISTEDAILFIERDYPLPVVEADFSAGVAGEDRWVGFLLDTPVEDDEER